MPLAKFSNVQLVNSMQ